MPGKLALYDGHGIVIWFSNWWRNVGVDVEVEMIWSWIVVCVVESYGGRFWCDVSEGVGSVVLENVDWNEYHSVVVVADWARQVEADHCLEVARVVMS